MASAYWVSRVVHAATELGLADHLSRGPQTADVLAGLTQTNPAALYRLLRTASSLGIFTEDATRRFALTPLGEAMKTGAPGAARASILTIGGRGFSSAWENLRYSVQTGKPGFDKANGVPIFDWLTAHPEEASLFGETMIGFHGAEPAAVAAAYDFSGFKTVVDVGGGTGNLLTTILAAQPGPRGVLFDLPHVVREAAPLIQQRGLTDRVETKSGSFFETAPAGGDAYLLSHVIHDWSEEQCLTILGRCRSAMKRHLPAAAHRDGSARRQYAPSRENAGYDDARGSGWSGTDGRRISDALEKAGFRLTRVIPTDSAVSIVEATRA